MATLKGLENTLRAWGVTVMTDWIVEGRPGSFTPTHVMMHHTAGPQGSPAPSRSVVRNGRPDLSGPLCQILVRRDNKVELVSRGRANHAGAGSWSGIPTDQGNTYAVGVEIEHVGTSAEPWTPSMLTLCRTTAAAILDHIGQPASRMCAHKEYAPSRKIDPYGWSMGSERSKVDALLKAGPAGVPPATTTTSEELNMFIAWHSDVPYLVDACGKRRLSVGSKDTIKNETRAAGHEIMDIGEVSSDFLGEFPTYDETGTLAGTSYNDMRAAVTGTEQLRTDVAALTAKVDQVLAALTPAGGQQ